MKQLFAIFSFFVFITSFSAFGASQSGIMLRPAGMYWSHQYKNGLAGAQEAKQTVNHFDLSIGLGFRMDSGLYLGGTYLLIQEETKTEVSSGTTENKDLYTNYGPTIGYVGENFFVLGTYHLSPVYVTGTDSSKSTYSGGYGYQVDLGYMFWISPNVGLGPQMTYFHADYKTVKNSAGVESTLPNTAEVTDLRPLVAFAFMF